MTLYNLAKEHLSIEELEMILEKKKKQSQPKPLKSDEIQQKMFYKQLTEGDKAYLYAPRYDLPQTRLAICSIVFLFVFLYFCNVLVSLIPVISIIT